MPTIDPGSILANPIVLGLVVFLIVHLIKALNVPKDGKETLWIVMGVALAVAAVDKAVGGGLAPLPPVPVTGIQDPLALVQFTLQILVTIAEDAGVLVAASQAIYFVLHQQILLGDAV